MKWPFLCLSRSISRSRYGKTITKTRSVHISVGLTVRSKSYKRSEMSWLSQTLDLEAVLQSRTKPELCSLHGNTPKSWISSLSLGTNYVSLTSMKLVSIKRIVLVFKGNGAHFSSSMCFLYTQWAGDKSAHGKFPIFREHSHNISFELERFWRQMENVWSDLNYREGNLRAVYFHLSFRVTSNNISGL